MEYTYEDAIQYWQQQKLQSKNDYFNILENFSVLFAYHSGVIENSQITYYDTREIFNNGKVINFTGDLKTLYEINNQKDCYEYLINCIIDKKQISEACIRKIHRILTKGTYDERRYITNQERPGEYKKHDYVTGRNEVGSTVENVQSDIQSLLEEINSASIYTTDDVIIISAYAHNVFEQIHPFADGNGRVGRVLVNYILMIHNLPPIIIYEEDKKYYYEALEIFDTKENLKPMVEFFKYEMEKTWTKSLERFIQK